MDFDGVMTFLYTAMRLSVGVSIAWLGLLLAYEVSTLAMLSLAKFELLVARVMVTSRGTEAWSVAVHIGDSISSYEMVFPVV